MAMPFLYWPWEPLNIDFPRPMQYHYDLAEKLKDRRNQGVLVIGSGNIVHNLRLVFSRRDNSPYDWAVEFDEWVRDRIIQRDAVCHIVI